MSYCRGVPIWMLAKGAMRPRYGSAHSENELLCRAWLEVSKLDCRNKLKDGEINILEAPLNLHRNNVTGKLELRAQA